jgi:hypothetical protein
LSPHCRGEDDTERCCKEDAFRGSDHAQVSL